MQGLAIPAHGKLPGAAASRRELRRRSRAGHPHFNVARARGFDPASTLTAMDIEGIDVAVMYGTRGRQILCHDDLAPDYAAALARAYNNWAADYCKTDPRRLKFAARSRCTTSRAVAEARRCVDRIGRRRGHRHPQPGQRPASARRGLRATVGRTRAARTCRSAFIRPAPLRCRTTPGGAMSGTPISTRSPMRSATRSS